MSINHFNRVAIYENTIECFTKWLCCHSMRNYCTSAVIAISPIRTIITRSNAHHAPLNYPEHFHFFKYHHSIAEKLRTGGPVTFMVLCAVFLVGAFAAHPLYPKSYNNHEDTIGTWNYNLRIFCARLPDQITSQGITYIVRFCSNQSQSNNIIDAFLTRCHGDKCVSCVTHNSLDYQPADPNNLSEGLIYYAKNIPFYDENKIPRTINLEWKILCDPSVTDPNSPASLSVITNSNSTILITGSIRHKSVCPKSDVVNPAHVMNVHAHSKSDTWHPPIPKKGPTPTPTPNPSPNPDFVVFNETSYVKLNLDMLIQSDFSDTLELYSGTEENQCNVDVKWQPWKPIPPPDGYSSQEFDLANMWVCWTDESIGPYCHPVGDRRMDIDMELIDKNDYSKGMTLKYRGAYGLNLEVDVLCNETEKDHSIPLDHNTKLAYHQTTSGPRILMFSDSSEVCPRKYAIPTIPPTPAASPEPTGKPVTHFEVTVNGTTCVADFDSMGYIRQKLLVGYDDKYELNTIFFNAVERISCPTGFTCLGNSQKSNVWRCINNQDCIPMADTRFGITYKMVDQNDIRKGISATFGGSYADTLTVNCICDERKYGFRFDELGDKTPAGTKITLTVRSRSFCSRHVIRISGGAVFLSIVLIPGVFYFGAGVLVTYIITGKPNVPNANFWNTFFSSISYLFAVLLACANTTKPETTCAETEYDRI